MGFALQLATDPVCDDEEEEERRRRRRRRRRMIIPLRTNNSNNNNNDDNSEIFVNREPLTKTELGALRVKPHPR